MLKLTKIVFFICFCITQICYGQDTILDLDKLQDIKVISASKEEESKSAAPANIIVITKEDIANRAYQTIEEVFKDLPGFDIQVGQPTGEYPSHFLFRGIGDVGQTKFVMMLDGVPQNDVSNGWFQNFGYNFTMADIERIELVSGPGAALYGMNSLSGYINIITKNYAKTVKNNYEIKLNNYYGSQKSYSPELFAWYRTKNNMAFQVSARVFKQEGDMGISRNDPGNFFHNNYEPDSVMTFSNGIIANETVAGRTKKINDGFNTHINDYDVRFKIMKEGLNISYTTWQRQEGLGSEVVGYEYFLNDKKSPNNIHHKGSSFNMSYNYDFNDRIKTYSKAYYNSNSILPTTEFIYTYQFQSVSNGINPIQLDSQKKYKSDGYLIGFEQQLNYKVSERNSIVAGVQFEQKIRQYFIINFDNSPAFANLGILAPTKTPVYFSHNAAFLIQDVHRFTDKLSFTAGLRNDVDQFYGKVFNPRLALVYSQPKGLNFKLLYGQAFKAPTIFELFDEWRGNDNLKFEKINTTEVELSYKKDKFTIAADAFYSHLRDLIILEKNPDTSKVKIGPSGQKDVYYQNIGAFGFAGLSITLNYKVVKNLTLQSNYQYTINANGSELDNVSAHKINFAINYLFKNKININFRGNYVSRIKAPKTNLYFQEKTAQSISNVGYDYVTEANPDGYLNGYLVCNLVVSGKNIYTYKKFTINPLLRVNNMFNTSYALIGRQSGDGTRPVDAIQSSIRNPAGFIPAYHPQAGIQFYIGLVIGVN